MSVVSKTYQLLPKATLITRPELVGVQILALMREGVGYKVVSVFGPGGRQVAYLPAGGKLVFQTPGNGPGGTNERVTVIYNDI